MAAGSVMWILAMVDGAQQAKQPGKGSSGLKQHALLPEEVVEPSQDPPCLTDTAVHANSARAWSACSSETSIMRQSLQQIYVLSAAANMTQVMDTWPWLHNLFLTQVVP